MAGMSRIARISILTAVVVALTAAAPAQADPGTFRPVGAAVVTDDGAPVSSGLEAAPGSTTGRVGPGDFSSAAVVIEYAPCTAKSAYPHQASTQFGWIHAEGTLDCSSWMSMLQIDGNLQRDRWYGRQTVHNGGYRNSNGGYKLKYVATFDCENGRTFTYYLRNYHQVLWKGSVYTAETANSNRVTCAG